MFKVASARRVQCPYCGNDLAEKPNRKKRCPHCSQYIYVRQGELLTEKQAEERDFISRWLYILASFGVTDRTLTKERERLSKQYGFEAPVRDVIWRILNGLISGQRELLEQERIYCLMAAFIEEEGKDPSGFIQQAMGIRREAVKAEVLGFKRNLSGFKTRVRINTANDNLVCNTCREAASRTYSIDEFLEQMPIPDKCENSRGCRCWVTASIK